MGNENSRKLHERSSSTEERPYTTSTQAIGESPRRLMKTQSLATASSHPAQKPLHPSLKHHIVTVHEAHIDDDTLANDPALLSLQTIPTFFPIIRDTVRNPVMKEVNSATKLDIQAATSLVTKYQCIVRDRTEDVAKKQQEITQRLQDMDYAMNTLQHVLQEKSRKLAKQTDQFNTVSQLKALLNSTQICLEKTEATLNRINRCLPEHLRLEPLDLSSGTAEES